MKHISDSERLTQATLNKKYMELEKANKKIENLEKQLECLKLQLAERKETICYLCQQISRLFLKQKTND